MSGVLITGLLSGLILALITSPVFFALINITSTKGKEAGAIFVAGIFSSNLIIFILALISFDLIIYEYPFQKLISIIIYVLIVILSLLMIFNLDRKLISKQIIYFKATNPSTVFLKGILLNILNPEVIILWSGIFLFYFLKFTGNKNEFILYFTGALITVLIFDIFKIFAANKFTHSVNPLYLLFLNKVIAAFLIIAVITNF